MTTPAAIPAARIREATEAVLARPVYDLSSPDHYGWELGWIWAIFEWILSPLDRLLQRLDDLPPGFQWVIYAVLVSILIALIAHIAYTVVMAFRRDEFTVSLPVDERPATIEELVVNAQRHAEAGDFVDASRLLYRAALLTLEEKRDGRLRKGLTNTEYLQTFKAPWVIENLRVFVDLINWKWYRDNRFEQSDYLACQRAYDAIQRRLREDFP